MILILIWVFFAICVVLLAVILFILGLLIVHVVDILEFLLELYLGNMLGLSKSLCHVAKPLLVLHTEVFNFIRWLLFGSIFFRETWEVITEILRKIYIDVSWYKLLRVFCLMVDNLGIFWQGLLLVQVLISQVGYNLESLILSIPKMCGNMVRVLSKRERYNFFHCWSEM